MFRKPTKIPISAGVYIFRRNTLPLYIGKAANLRQRLASYFRERAELPMKIQRMLEEATRLETIETASEIEALIKEAELIKKYRPKYNLLMRDDKSYFYIGITKEPFPRIFITHEPRQVLRITNKTELRTTKTYREQFRNSKNFVIRRSARYIGPFTSGSALKSALKLLRRIFPFCTCGRPHKRPCLNSEIGRCPGYCCTIVASSRQLPATSKRRSEYRKNIRNIVAVLSGDRTRLVGRLKREMKEAVKKERYEEAARLRDALFGLEDVFAHRQVLHTPEARLPDGQAHYPWPVILGKLQALLKTKRDISRIEGYDISNISGTGATGSMVVFTNGLPDKSQYRKFRIRTVAGSNDVAMLKEVLARRFKHSEWQQPNLLVIDGGKGQLNTALGVIRRLKAKSQKLKAPIVTALAKREEILFTEKGQTIYLQRHDPTMLHLFQRVRDESHRFARAYHHKLREKSYAAAR